MRVEFLVLPNGTCPVEEFFEGLDDKTVAKVYRYIEILENEGSLPFPHARKMQGYGDLWELRVSGRAGAVRVFYVYHEKHEVIFVSGFIKKSQKTPQRELKRVLGYLRQSGAKI